MSMVKCSECKQEISDKAEKCPHCGAPLPKKASALKLILIALVAFAVIRMMMGGDSTTRPTGSTTVAQNAPIAKPQPKEWQYSTDTDKVSGKQSKDASITSNNSHELAFPYQGGTTGFLLLRKHPRFGKDVIFTITKGQLLCRSYDGCQVSIKFDDKPPIKVNANEPEDHSNETLFLQGYERLIKELKASKKTVVEVIFYQQGNRTFEFNTAGLKWD